MLRHLLLPSYELKKTRRADLNSVITINAFTSRRPFMWSVIFRYSLYSLVHQFAVLCFPVLRFPLTPFMSCLWL